MVNTAFYDSAVFDPSPLTVCINCIFTYMKFYECLFMCVQTRSYVDIKIIFLNKLN